MIQSYFISNYSKTFIYGKLSYLTVIHSISSPLGIKLAIFLGYNFLKIYEKKERFYVLLEINTLIIYMHA